MNLSQATPLGGGGGGQTTADVIHENNGPFDTVESTSLTDVDSFTMPYEGMCVARIDYTDGGGSANYNRIFQITGPGGEVDFLANARNYPTPQPVWPSGRLTPGAYTVRVAKGSSSSSYNITVTKITVFAWKE